MDEQIKFLKQLVKTKSFSGEEGPVAEVIIEKMSHLGYSKIEIGKHGSVVGTIGKGKPFIILEGHMDIVRAGNRKNWKYCPFSGEIFDNEIYGRGAVDMKGPLSSMIYGTYDIKEEIKQLGGTVKVACVVHEETIEGVAIRKLIEKYNNPDLVILGEPSNLDLCIGHRGRIVLKITIRGESAHASMPNLGKNAALNLIDLLNSLRGENLDVDKKLGRETMALINVSSGLKEGAVLPEKATAKLDFRIGRNTKKEDILRLVQRLMDNEPELSGKVEILKKSFGCYTGESLSQSFYFPAWYFDNKSVLGAIKRSLGFLKNSKERIWEFSTDGTYTAGKANLPTVGFGPGDDKLAHQPDERVSIDQLELARKGYQKIILDKLNGKIN